MARFHFLFFILCKKKISEKELLPSFNLLSSWKFIETRKCGSSSLTSPCYQIVFSPDSIIKSKMSFFGDFKAVEITF